MLRFVAVSLSLDSAFREGAIFARKIEFSRYRRNNSLSSSARIFLIRTRLTEHFLTHDVGLPFDLRQIRVMPTILKFDKLRLHCRIEVGHTRRVVCLDCIQLITA